MELTTKKSAYAIIGTIIVIIIFLLSFQQLNDHFQTKLSQELDATKKNTQNTKSYIIESTKENIKETLNAVKNDYTFKKYLKSQTSKKEVTELFKTLIQTIPNAFQLRYINNDGKEVIRVDQKDNNTFIMTDDKLQDKSHRYYFQNSIQLQKDEIWYSKLDLNVENNKIETPHKPTLRVATPVFIDKQKMGIVIINYDMSIFLNKLTSSPTLYLSLVNKDGYVLFSNNPNQENWTRYIDPYAAKHNFDGHHHGILERLDLGIPNDENLSLHIHLKNNSVDDLIRHQQNIALLYSCLIALILFIILFILYSNVNLKLAVEKALKRERKFNQNFNQKLSTEVSTKTKELLESKNDIEKLFNAVPIPIAYIDNRNFVYKRNDSFNQLFGFEENEFLDIDTWFKKIYPGSTNYKEAIKRWNKYIDEASKNSGIIQSDLYWIYNNKNDTNYAISIGGILHDNGLIATFVDMTEEIDAKERLEHNNEKLRSQLEEIEEQKKELDENQNQLAQYLVKLENISRKDLLTGLMNRLELDERVLGQIGSLRRYQTPFSALLLDIDCFKLINDTYGHDIGDYVLKELGKILKNNIRSTDVAGRWGGEEFMIICENTNIQSAEILAEKIRKLIHNYKFEKIPCLSVSIGVTEFTKNDDEKTFFKRLDNGLYIAKNCGRNKVVAIKGEDSVK